MIKRSDILKTLGTVVLLASVCFGARAQEAALKIGGSVTDRFGNPLCGALVVSSGGANMMVTDFHGAFEMMVTDRSEKLLVSCPGFATGEAVIDIDNTVLKIALNEDSFDRDLPVDLGYSTFRREEISGAVSTVLGSELEKSPVQTTREAFAGRFPGLYTYEASSEPSGANTQMWLRGATTMRNNQPALILDGIVFDYNQEVIMNMITPSEIEAVTVLKDAASQALYGIQGGDGVIVMTTKRGRPGPLQVKVRADARVQQVSTTPTIFGSAAYAELRNEAFRNDNGGDVRDRDLPFPSATLEQFRLGEDREHYPENIWYDKLFRKVSMVQRAGVDIYGGSENITYYSNVNFMHQGSHFNTDPENAYNSNFRMFWVNFRSNVDLKINKYLSADLRLAGNIKRDNTPTTNMSTIYDLLFYMPPTAYGPTTPHIMGPDPDNPGHEIVVVPGGEVVTTQNMFNAGRDTPYARLNRIGYGKSTFANIYSQVGIKLDMGFLARGLELSGSIGYRTESNNMLNNTRSYQRYGRIGSYDELEFDLMPNTINGTLRQSKATTLMHLLNYKGMLNYRNSFGRHHVGAVAYMYFQQLTRNDTGGSNSLPYARVNTGFEASYNFDNRYLLRLDAGYSGSEQYARSSRFVWTPAFSAAWVLSNEKFMQGARWLSMLKFRGSYGVTATDRSGLSRFAYLDNVELNRAPSWLEWEIKELSFGDPSIHAERIRKTNLGIDLGLFNQLNISVDVFREHTTDMAIPSDAAIPNYYGYGSLFPMINGGEFRNEGYEVSVDYHKAIDRDWSFGVGGWVSYTRNNRIFTGELPQTEEYAYPYRSQGYPVGQQFGYLVDYAFGAGNGMFNTNAELSQRPEYSFGTPRQGDLVYRDVNEDGIINAMDQVPLGDGTIPPTVYSFYGNLRWKGLELSVLFQGIGRWNLIMTGMGIFEGGSNNDGVFSSLHTNAWTWERYTNDQEITFPALSFYKSTSHEASDFYIYNRSYLRLKNLEVAYNLPQRWMRKIKVDNIRVSLSGQNLWTWDKMKTKDFGPEGGGYTAFPVMRIYNLGLTLQF